MKIKLLVLAGLLTGGALSAQKTDETKTLLRNSEKIDFKKLGYFIAPSYGASQLDGSHASLINLRGGVQLNSSWGLGAYYAMSVNQVKPQSETVPMIYLDYRHTGAFVEYTLLSKRLVHLTFPLYFGVGEVEMDNEQFDLDLGEAHLVQIEPSALLELNLSKYARLATGVGYRLVSPVEYRNFSQTDLAGLTGYIGLKFGLLR